MTLFSTEPELIACEFFPMGVALPDNGIHRCPECGVVNVSPGDLGYNLKDCKCECGHEGPSETFWRAARGDKGE